VRGLAPRSLADGNSTARRDRSQHLPASVRTRFGETAGQEDGDLADLPTLEAVERAHIERVLAATGGRRRQAAEILGISERNLDRKLREPDAP
jgi:DNA-binding NtrC family response regulator